MEHRIKVYIDHQALKFLSTCTENSSRIARWFEFLQEFDLDIVHIPEKQNDIADALSRSFTDVPTKIKKDKTKFIALISSPRDGQDISQWADFIKDAQQNSELLQNDVRNRPNVYKMREGIIRKWTPVGERIPIPEEVAWDFMNLVHRYLLHFGTDKVIDFVERYFYFKSVDRFARNVLASCHVCLATKHYTKATVGKYYYKIPRKPMKTISMDLCGPLPQTASGKKYILVLSDHFSKLTKLYPITNQKIDTICEVLRTKYLPEIGVSEEILTDKSGQFGCNRWQLFSRDHGFRHTSPYNPQSNLVERVMREINRILRAYAHGRQNGTK